MQTEQAFFWDFIDKSIHITQTRFPNEVFPKTDLFYEKQAEILTEMLTNSSDEEIYLYEKMFWYHWDLAYDINVYTIFFVLVYGLTFDDHFRNMQCWVIARGKDFFYKALHHPDDVVDLIERDDTYHIEDFFGIANEAFRKKYHPREIHEDLLPSNQKMPSFIKDALKINEIEFEENLPTLYPNLWKKFGWKD